MRPEYYHYFSGNLYPISLTRIESSKRFRRNLDDLKAGRPVTELTTRTQLNRRSCE
jgi:hypothetical protein